MRALRKGEWEIGTWLNGLVWERRHGKATVPGLARDWGNEAGPLVWAILNG